MKCFVLSAHAAHFTLVCAGKNQYDILSVHDRGVKVLCDIRLWIPSLVRISTSARS